MIRSAIGRAAWVGRTAPAVFGLAVILALALASAAPAMAQTTQPIAEAGEGRRFEIQGEGDCQELNNPQRQGLCDYVFVGGVVETPITNRSGDLEDFESAGITGQVTADFKRATYTQTTYSDAPTSGEVYLQEPPEEGDDEIRLVLVGTSSGNRDRTGTTTFDGTFTVQGGTGRYEGACGEGTFTTVTLATPTGDRFTADFDGTLVLPEDPTGFRARRRTLRPATTGATDD